MFGAGPAEAAELASGTAGADTRTVRARPLGRHGLKINASNLALQSRWENICLAHGPLLRLMGRKTRAARCPMHFVLTAWAN